MLVPQAWRVTRGDPRVVIAVVDLGVGADPDLAPNLLPGYNAIDGSADTTDENGHGSEQAALIGAVLDNGLGAAGICGRCRVLPVKVFGADGRAGVDTLTRGIRWAAAQGAEVINLSFALEPGSAPSPLLNDAIADAVGRGITVVAGAGNNGSADPAANALAATNPQVIRVASIDTESHRLDAGSNRGPGSTWPRRRSCRRTDPARRPSATAARRLPPRRCPRSAAFCSPATPASRRRTSRTS